MEVILTQDVDNLGEKNDVVSIKAGYGRNFLIPQGFAKVANETNRKILAEKPEEIQDAGSICLIQQICICWAG